MTVQEKCGLLMLMASLEAMGHVHQTIELIAICIVFTTGWILFWLGGKKDDLAYPDDSGS